MIKPKFDEFTEICNGEDTYGAIAEVLKNQRSCIIGWTDERGSHFDVLFNILPLGFAQRPGTIQKNINIGFDLFVSIMKVGAFAFDISRHNTDFHYIEEKFNFNFGETTGKALADLINGIRIKLSK